MSGDTGLDWTWLSLPMDDPGRAMSANRRTLDELLDAARAEIARLEPVDAHAAAQLGALLIDIRGQVDRERDGIVPGSLHIAHGARMAA